MEDFTIEAYTKKLNMNNSDFDENFGNFNESNSTDYDLTPREYIFDRQEVRIIFIILYSIVFCCCFFGEWNESDVKIEKWSFFNNSEIDLKMKLTYMCIENFKTAVKKTNL